MRRCLSTALSWLCWLLLAGASQSYAASVLILSSERSPSFSEASDSLISELERGGIARADIVQMTASEWVTTDIGSIGTPKLVITLGTEALRQGLSREVKAPFLAALLPRAGFDRVLKDLNRRSGFAVSGVFLDQPFVRQLELLRLALPDAKRIGVLWGADTGRTQALFQSAVQGRGLSVESGHVVEASALFPALKQVLDQSDVLLAVADGQIFNSGTISNILLATYRARIPVMAFSPAYVRAGALLSLHTTAAQTGLQAGGMARQMMQGANPGLQYPSEFQVTVNDHVARSLGLTLDGAQLTDRLRSLGKRP